jgi:F-type H+-transporting ATPase subunit b
MGIALAILATTVPAPLWGQDEHGNTPLFTVNLGTSVWATLVFLVLLGILYKFAWGPILSAVEAREVGIQGALDEAAEKHAEAGRLLEEYRAQMADTRREAHQIIAEAKEAGQRVRKEIEEKARIEGREMLERAKTTIERERDAALEALRRESVEIAIAAASKLIRERLDSDADRGLVIDYVDGLSDQERGAEA